MKVVSIITWNKIIVRFTFITSLYLVGVLRLINLTMYSSNDYYSNYKIKSKSSNTYKR